MKGTWHTSPPIGGTPDRIKIYTPGDPDSAVEYMRVSDHLDAIREAKAGIVHCRPCPHNGVCATGGCVYRQGQGV